MKRWYWSAAAVLGLGSAGVLFGSSRGRQVTRKLRDRIASAPEGIGALNDGVMEEIQSIRESLGRVARMLGKDAEQILR